MEQLSRRYRDGDEIVVFAALALTTLPGSLTKWHSMAARRRGGEAARRQRFPIPK